MPRGSPLGMAYQRAKARRQAALEALYVLPDFRRLAREPGVSFVRCPWRYMFALANGQFDLDPDGMAESEFTTGSLRFYENGSLFKFVGDNVAPEPWNPSIVQYAIFQDKRRVNPQPLICVRNAVRRGGATSSSSSSSSSTTMDGDGSNMPPPPPKRRKTQSEGGSAQAHGAGPIAA